MTRRVAFKPTQKAIKQYYETLGSLDAEGVTHEGALRSAFQNLLSEGAQRHGWILIPELSDVSGDRAIRPDGTLRDEFHMVRGHWEAKDTRDDLETEIRKKSAQGYPLGNIIFEDTRSAVLYQNGERVLDADIRKPTQLADLLNRFFSYVEPALEDFGTAIEDFRERVPELARALVQKIQAAHKENPAFAERFSRFYDLCRESLNPNLSIAAVDEMLVQHLLTERLIRRIFGTQDFVRRNVIASEVEGVIDALVSRSFNRHDFLRSLDRFYVAIESAAETISGFDEKQHFLNVVYEQFFQGYSVKVADTHGIVYTPQPIVQFMTHSVADVLRAEFGVDLADETVHILDPCTGTGNFVVNLLRQLPKRHLRDVYRNRFFANEVMLMPYYISALNIEHAYYELTGQYEPFDGLCFADTLDLAEGLQTNLTLVSEANTDRVEREREAPITVIIANPPYNIGQLNENDNNKNRAYPVIDRRIHETYVQHSGATLSSKLYDPYARFLRWATDRLQKRDGILCFITNNSFIDQTAFDGMRACLEREFTHIYHLDLEGNVRRHPKLSGTMFNVFGIRVGVGITIAIKRGRARTCKIRYHAMPADWRRERKLEWLAEVGSYCNVKWETITPDKNHNWLVPDESSRFERLVTLGSKAARKAAGREPHEVVFHDYSLGVSTNRDATVYSSNLDDLTSKVMEFCAVYNAEVDRLARAGEVEDLDEFVDRSRIKWSSTLKNQLARGKEIKYDSGYIRKSLYRPFAERYLYLSDLAVDRPGHMRAYFPASALDGENCVICVPTIGNRGDWAVLAARLAPNLNLTSIDGFQCFPLYTYGESTQSRRENVTDWSLDLFRSRYQGQRITRRDVFDYVYGILHHPAYVRDFQGCLRKQLPRIPLVRDADQFRQVRRAGSELIRLHTHYEELEPWPLEWIESRERPLDYRVDKMRLSTDRKTIVVNSSLSLGGVPQEVYEYRLGNRSALEWVIDQFRVKCDKSGRVLDDPNRSHDPEYVVRLLGQVVRVSVDTLRLAKSLPDDYGGSYMEAAGE